MDLFHVILLLGTSVLQFGFAESFEVNQVCALLASISPEEVIVAGNGSDYTLLREAHDTQNVWKMPLCIYSPRSPEDLSKGINVLVATNSSFAIRGGGHSALPGWANIDNGVLITTNYINDREYDRATETVRLGFGNTWGDVYQYLETFGRLVVGGRAPTVGLATILGGGLSHLSNQYGFVSDNVISFEMITADGILRVVNATSNPDLFFALKAGSNNFGIVTHVTLRTYPVGKVWGGALVYNNDNRDKIMQAFAAYQQSGQLDEKSAIISYLGVTNDTNYVILVYLDSVERPSAFDSFYAIPQIFDGTRLHDNFTSLLNEQVDRVVHRWTLGATTLLLDEATYVDVGRLAQETATSLTSINGGTMVLMPQPISSSMVSQSTSRGSNPMTASLKNSPQLWFCINIGWNLESDDARIDQILMDALANIEKLTKSRKLYDSFVFANDAHWSQNPPRRYGMNTFRKLKAISREVDPEGLFQNNVPGGFKLRDSVNL